MDIVLTMVLLISLTGCVKPASVESRNTAFYDRATYMLQSFDTNFNTATESKGVCVKRGKEKSNEFNKNDYDNNYRKAVALVNIFTQDCELSNNGLFYAELNTRISNSATNVEPYSTFAKLLDEAIDILSKDNGVTGETVYRGQCDKFPSSGMYTPKRFTSTSHSVIEALTFPGDEKNCFVVIENATGVDVSLFSFIKKEQELLISYRATFKVKEKIINATQTKKKIIQLNSNAAHNIYSSSLKRKDTFVVLVYTGTASDHAQTADASFRKTHLALYFLVSVMTVYLKKI